MAGRRPEYTASADWQGMYSTIPIHWNIKSAPASPGRSRVGPAFYVFSFLGTNFPGGGGVSFEEGVIERTSHTWEKCRSQMNVYSALVGTVNYKSKQLIANVNYELKA